MTRRPPTASGIESNANDRITVVNPDSDLDRLPSSQSLRGLDWLNFLLADVQTGVGPFLAIYLAAYGWNEQGVGLALTGQRHRRHRITNTGRRFGGPAQVQASADRGGRVRVGGWRAIDCGPSVVLAGRDSTSADRRNVRFLHARHRSYLTRNRRAQVL